MEHNHFSPGASIPNSTSSRNQRNVIDLDELYDESIGMEEKKEEPSDLSNSKFARIMDPLHSETFTDEEIVAVEEEEDNLQDKKQLLWVKQEEEMPKEHVRSRQNTEFSEDGDLQIQPEFFRSLSGDPLVGEQIIVNEPGSQMMMKMDTQITKAQDVQKDIENRATSKFIQF